MQTFSLSPQEAVFVSQYGQLIEDVASDLTNAHRQIYTLSYAALRQSVDSALSRIKPLVYFFQDIENDLNAIMNQMFDLRYSGLPAVVVDFEGEPVPLLFNTVERANYDGTLTSIGYAQSAGYSIADTDQAIRGLGPPLAKFLASRSTQTTFAAVTPTVPNVTVSNNASGWQIVYQPYYGSGENGFGGPSTPVSGFLHAGRFRFGIKQGNSPAQWDSTSWNIPFQNQVHVPLP